MSAHELCQHLVELWDREYGGKIRFHGKDCVHPLGNALSSDPVHLGSDVLQYAALRGMHE